MAQHTLGLIMHGVTGRMGMNQHLIRSIVAIRNQGGVRLSNGDTVMPDPILIGRNAEKMEALAKAHNIARWGTDLDAALANKADTVFFDAGTTQMRPTLLAKAIRAGKHVYCEKPIATNLNEAVEIARLAQSSGLKHGAVQDKLFLPGLRKLDMLRRAGFFGRMLSVRLEFGYWVFEGDLQPIQRPSWNYRKEDGGGMILDMMCHWRYVLDNLFGEVKSVSCLGTTHIPTRWDEAGQPYACTADDAAYATAELIGHNGEPVIAQLNMSWATRVRRDDLVTFHVDGTHGSAVAGLSSCRAQSRVATPRPVWNPDEKQTMNFMDQWQEIPGHPGLRQRLQDPVGALHPPRGRGRALPLDAARRRQGRAAGRGRAGELEGAALGRCETAGSGLTGVRPCIDFTTRSRNRFPQGRPMTSTLQLAGADGALAPYTLRGKPPARPTAGPAFNRIAYSAAHVVADPRAAIDPWLQCAVDWDATIAYRRHLWSLGLGVAESMDTAQRGMGLDWPTSLELIRRSLDAAKDVPGALVASGCGTDHLVLDEVRSVDDVIRAYEEQMAAIEKLGGKLIVMASRALARVAKSPADYERVYDRILRQSRAAGRSCTGWATCSTRPWPATGAHPI